MKDVIQVEVELKRSLLYEPKEQEKIETRGERERDYWNNVNTMWFWHSVLQGRQYLYFQRNVTTYVATVVNPWMEKYLFPDKLDKLYTPIVVRAPVLCFLRELKHSHGTLISQVIIEASLYVTRPTHYFLCHKFCAEWQAGMCEHTSWFCLSTDNTCSAFLCVNLNKTMSEDISVRNCFPKYIVAI